jgi:hypothetical protein
VRAHILVSFSTTDGALPSPSHQTKKLQMELKIKNEIQMEIKVKMEIKQGSFAEPQPSHEKKQMELK